MTSHVPAISAKWVRMFRFVYDHVSSFYDSGQRHMIPFKKMAVTELNLEPGDRVIVLCCGTGLEFPFIQKCIGPEGKILGIDWSGGMLARAQRRIEDNGWSNVQLFEGDVTALPESLVPPASYDAGICTLGLSILGEPDKAFRTLKNAVGKDGKIVIGDVCSFSGRKAFLNPFNTLIDLIAGNTHRSLARSRAFAESVHSDLMNAKLAWYLGGSYYIVSGRTLGDW
ncbi:class I SAM-dependent methyltransferase [Nocardia alni]|uniref:class I SAM-dependent methyltransferase n=1 Tax=Nocardia alni TaxID=2815723 RepID=UPI0020B1E15E|nr:methyltransferase domain-containing protein [Nocardia alni]